MTFENEARLPHCCKVGGYTKSSRPNDGRHCGPCWEDLAAEEQYQVEAAAATDDGSPTEEEFAAHDQAESEAFEAYRESRWS
jgi:hypothetical protein